MNQLVKGLIIGSLIGGAVGSWMRDSKNEIKKEFDADLVVYQNLAPTVVVEPTSTLTPAPLVHNCLTPEPTSTPESAKAIAAYQEWVVFEKKEAKEHANDFIPMPNPKSTYQGVSVEFFPSGPSKWVIRDYGKDYEPSDKEKSPYEKFYGVENNEKILDKTIINGFYRRDVFDSFGESEEFKSLHKPFFGIKAIQYLYGDLPDAGRPAPRWIYIVWSVSHKAPIPFPYPSQAVELVKRQQVKK